ncbi:MAG: hypothetical protein JWL88_456 [Parcubacteria group bacterium]|nr:hypothetical protein [Parcubacteria group bacterium]
MRDQQEIDIQTILDCFDELSQKPFTHHPIDIPSPEQLKLRGRQERLRAQTAE